MQPTSPPHNPLAEIAAFVLSGLLIAGAVILLALGKIDFPYATSLFLLAVGILSTNVALKAPSPAQQQQIQALVTQLMSVLPGVVASIQTPPLPTVSAPVPAVPVSAAAQPAPVQIAPAPAAPPVEFPERFAGDQAVPGT